MGRPKDAAAQGAEPSAARGDPRTYDYSGPSRTCDIVMKGGITSGVVYPHAICELARTYRFVDVGGTSAGGDRRRRGRCGRARPRAGRLPQARRAPRLDRRRRQPPPALPATARDPGVFRLFAAGAAHRRLPLAAGRPGGIARFPLTALAGVCPAWRSPCSQGGPDQARSRSARRGRCRSRAARSRHGPRPRGSRSAFRARSRATISASAPAWRPAAAAPH